MSSDANHQGAEVLKQKILDKKARVCVIGLGYVGLPLEQ